MLARHSPNHHKPLSFNMAPSATRTSPKVDDKGVVANNVKDVASKKEERQLPVTLLSGFLGSGKSTLLEHILRSKEHGMKVAVIVNDMGELNIDAALLQHHNVAQKQERVVEMQNGCICCTLRGDLLEEVADLAKNRNVDYLLIESSGISEPMQVAESFSPEFAEMHIQAGHDLEDELDQTEDAEMRKSNQRVAQILRNGGLSKISRLDTCVTVVDAVNVLSDFETADFLIDRHDRSVVPEEDDRSLSDLMTDQLEFSYVSPSQRRLECDLTLPLAIRNVVIVNKTDLVKPEELAKIKQLIHVLNPGARVIESQYGKINPQQVLDTQLFNYEKATLSAGWLQSLQEKHNPETIEYDIASFVYRARRPFHPKRLWQMIRKVFVVIQDELIDDGFDKPEEGEEDDENEGEKDEAMSNAEDDAVNSDPDGERAAMETDDEGSEDEESQDKEDIESEDEQDETEEAQPQLNPKARLDEKKASPTFGPLLRSKGFVWLATRPLMFGEWSQAGVMLTLSGGSRWRCEVPRDEWADDPEIVKAILADFEEPYGDRRQELVLIGHKMKENEPRLRAEFDKCLLDDDEMATFSKIMLSKSKKLRSIEAKQKALEQQFEDGFEDWYDDMDPELHAGHNH